MGLTFSAQTPGAAQGHGQALRLCGHARVGQTHWGPEVPSQVSEPGQRPSIKAASS